MTDTHTATYNLMKRTIEKQIQRGTLDVEATLLKLDVFLMGDRISADEYQELVELVKEQEDAE